MPRILPELLDPSNYPVSERITTRFADVDPNWHINNVAMTAMLEDARSRFDFFVTSPPEVQTVGSVIAANYIDFIAEAHYPEPVDVHIGVIEIGRTSWTLGCLATQHGRPVAFARSVLVATKDGVPTEIPAQFRAGLGDATLGPRTEKR